MKFKILKLVEKLEEDNIFGQETPDETKAKLDSIEKGLYPEEDIENLEEDVDTGKDEENDSVEEIADEMQDETGAEEEEEDNTLDTQLEDLREVLPDLDLNLYQVTNKEDTNKIFYFIGKVADDSDDILMLVDKNPSEDDEEPSTMLNEIPLEDDNEVDDLEDEKEETIENENDDESKEERFDFVVIPSRYDDLVTMSPRYGDELNPNHEDIMEYLMGCLVKVNPERAEELSSEKDVIDEDNTKIPLDPDIQADIDNKIEHYNNNLNR